MNKQNNIEIDCTRYCKSKVHSGIIISAITKRAVSDEALASYFYCLCKNFNKVVDQDGGRTGLHMAASCGRAKLTSWLSKTSPLSVLNKKDMESGFTALHRAVFYGQIDAAVALIKNGIKQDIFDKDDYIALDHALMDNNLLVCSSRDKAPCDAFAWGTNTNFTLAGIRPGGYPNYLNWKYNAPVSKVYLGKFHSVWLAENGDVFVCGQTGRVGAPQAPTVVTPTLLKLPEPCRMAAVALESTVFLMESGSIYQYTLKDSSTQTIVPNTKSSGLLKLPQAKPILKLSKPEGVCSSKNHFAVWSEFVVYTWGLNFGQLGHSPNEKVVPTPVKVTAVLQNISQVCASEAATLIYTEWGDVYLLHNHICKRIISKLLHVKKLCVDAKVCDNGALSRVTVVLLNSNSEMMIWQDATEKLTLCSLGVNHQVLIKDVCLTHDCVYFTTSLGSAFVGYISRKEPKKAIKSPAVKDTNLKAKELKEMERVVVRLERISNIHRAKSICCDAEGLNFVCLQYTPSWGLTSLPYLSESSLGEDIETLLDTVSQDDLLHDVIFKIGAKFYPAHIFFFASQSELIRDRYIEEKRKTSMDSKPVISLTEVHHLAFERIMRWLYTGSCDVTRPGKCSLKLLKTELIGDSNEFEEKPLEIQTPEINPSDISAFEANKRKKNMKSRNTRVNTTPNAVKHLYCDPVKLVQSAAKKLQIMTLHKALDRFFYSDDMVRVKERAQSYQDHLMFERDLLLDMTDTILKSKDGVEIPAHKCVLAARLEYFNGMFMHSWHESKENTVITLPYKHSILLPIIDFLYTDRCPQIENSDSMEFLTTMMIVADQLFVIRLREICEVSLSNLLNLKNCAELCQFAHTYNATQLKKCCMEFISLNVATLLESCSLEPLCDDLLRDIKEYYRSLIPIMSSRVITPYSDAVDDEIVLKAADTISIDLDSIDEDLKAEDLTDLKSKRLSKTPKKSEFSKNERERRRHESVNLDSEETKEVSPPPQNLTPASPKNEAWVKISNNKVQARLKAIVRAKDLLEEPVVEASVVLNAVTTPEPVEELRKSLGSITITRIGPKLSQKQRKKLSMDSPNTSNLENETIASGTSPSKNPWKVVSPPSTSSSLMKKDVGFDTILADQRRQKDDYSRITTKPLNLTQLEDRAIEDLERFYNQNFGEDEIIVVRRVEIKLTSPQWIHSSNKTL